MNAGVALVTTATITGLTATGASVASANVGTAVVTGLTVTGASIASVNVGAAVFSGNLTLNGGTANGVLYLNGSKVATSGSALTFDGTATVTLGGSGADATFKHGATNGRLILSGDSAGTSAITITGSTYATANAIRYDGTTHTWSNTTGTGYMLLNSTGLGIGTTSPSTKVHSKASNNQYLAEDASGNVFYVQNTGGEVALNAYLSTTARMPIVFKQYTTEIARFDSSGNLGLGVTPSAWESNYRVFDIGTNGTVYNYTNGAMAVGNNLYVTSGVFKYKISSYAPTLYAQFTGQHAWYTAASGTAGNTITWTTVLAVEGGKSLALEGATSQSGTGITFPATQSASSNANTLDDYEEGTWTPEINTTTPPTTAFGQYNDGSTYTKIGNVVYIRGQFRTNGVNLTGAGGTVYIGGLPFAPADDFSGGITVTQAGTWAADTPRSGYSISTSRIQLTSTATATGSITTTPYTALTTGTGLANLISIFGFYRV